MVFLAFIQPCSQPIYRMMAYDPNAHRPFTLWFETLPTGDTARVLISPHGQQVHALFYWNREFHSERCFTSRRTAETWGYELRDTLQQDVLAGVLLGYDNEVLARLP